VETVLTVADAVSFSGALVSSVTAPEILSKPVVASVRLPVSNVISLIRARGLMVSVAVRVTPLRLAVMVAVVVAPTALVVTVKVALLAPAATVTVAGVVADALLSDKVTAAPPAGAGPLKVTVPVEELPPVTLAGLNDTVESTGGLIGGGLIVNVAVCKPL